MTDTLKRLARLRHIEETEALRKLGDAREAEARHADALTALQQRLHHLVSAEAPDVDDLAHRHRAALQLELARRRGERQSTVFADRTARSRDALLHASRELQRTERMVELSEERDATDERVKEQRQLDQIGTRSWLRRSAA